MHVPVERLHLSPKLKRFVFFCQRKRKRCGEEFKNLSQCLSFEADERVAKSAERKNVHRLLLAILYEDLVAKEVRYHNSFFRAYTKGCEITLDVGKEDDRALTTKSPEFQAHTHATEKIVKFVQKRVIKDLDICQNDRYKRAVFEVFGKQWSRCSNIQN